MGLCRNNLLKPSLVWLKPSLFAKTRTSETLPFVMSKWQPHHPGARSAICGHMTCVGLLHWTKCGKVECPLLLVIRSRCTCLHFVSSNISRRWPSIGCMAAWTHYLIQLLSLPLLSLPITNLWCVMAFWESEEWPLFDMSYYFFQSWTRLLSATPWIACVCLLWKNRGLGCALVCLQSILLFQQLRWYLAALRSEVGLN